MAVFRIELRYENPRFESLCYFRANCLAEAEALCNSIVSFQEEMVLELERKNVFVSRRLVGCSASEDLEDHVEFVDYYGHLVLPPSDVQLLSPRP